MTEEQVDAILDASEAAVQQMIGTGLDTALPKGYAFFSFLAEITAKMRSRTEARDYLLRCDETDEGAQMAVTVMQFMPMLINMGLSTMAQQARIELPGPPTGRKRALSREQQQVLCRFVGDLVLKGVTKDNSYKRASQRFGVSKNTVARTWGKRKEIMSGAQELTADDAQQAMQSLLLGNIYEMFRPRVEHPSQPA